METTLAFSVFLMPATKCTLNRSITTVTFVYDQSGHISTFFPVNLNVHLNNSYP